MPRRGIIPRLWDFARKYLVALFMLGAFGAAMFEVYVTGTGPVPQQPPEGYAIEELTATLRWDNGTRGGPVTLEVSVDDPGFAKPLLSRETASGSYALRDLEPGRTYYWRLVQAGRSSPVASFKTSPYAVTF